MPEQVLQQLVLPPGQVQLDTIADDAAGQVFGREQAFAELSVGDTGARPYLARHPVALVPCDDVADGTDVDHRPAGGA